MAATNSTSNLGLPQWEATDKPERADFNTAMSDIDNTVAAHLADYAALLPRIAWKRSQEHDPATPTTGPSMSIRLDAKGTYLLTAHVYGNGRDPNHAASGTWLITWGGGGTNRISAAELLGTVHKVGLAQGLTVSAPNADGDVLITFTQTNSMLSAFKAQIVRLGEG